MSSIGIITPENSLKQIMEIDQKMQKKCKITYLIYTSLEHLRALYMENAEKYDAFLFSGSYPRDYLESCAVFDGTKPHACFELTDRDYYRTLARVAIQYPQIPFSHVAFEVSDGYQLDFETIFMDKERPIVRPPMNKQEYYSSLSDLYDIFYDYYRDLKEEGRLELVVTKISSLIPRLNKLGVICEYIAPSKESMMETFYDLLIRMEKKEASETATAFCMIASPKDAYSDVEQAALQDTLSQYNRLFGMNFIINSGKDHYELTTSSKTLKSITKNFTTCPVTAYLHETLNFPVCVGWGCDQNVIISYRNTQRAVKESRLCGGHPAFIVLEDNQIIGPLSSKRRIRYTDHPDSRIAELSQKVSLSPLCIRKLISVMNQRNSSTISSEELAYFLNVTVRSASRILTKLADCGAAEVTYNRQMNLRGRPAKIYTVDFSKI